jgi:hypothetical protein
MDFAPLQIAQRPNIPNLIECRIDDLGRWTGRACPAARPPVASKAAFTRRASQRSTLVTSALRLPARQLPWHLVSRHCGPLGGGRRSVRNHEGGR